MRFSRAVATASVIVPVDSPSSVTPRPAGQAAGVRGTCSIADAGRIACPPPGGVPRQAQGWTIRYRSRLEVTGVARRDTGPPGERDAASHIVADFDGTTRLPETGGRNRGLGHGDGVEIRTPAEQTFREQCLEHRRQPPLLRSGVHERESEPDLEHRNGERLSSCVAGPDGLSLARLNPGGKPPHVADPSDRAPQAGHPHPARA